MTPRKSPAEFIGYYILGPIATLAALTIVIFAVIGFVKLVLSW